MIPIRIKICGLVREEDIMAVNRFRPDYAGFVFAGGRHRVTIDQARRLSRQLSREIVPVGVFIHESVEDILRLLDEEVIRVIQLHGSVDESRMEALRRRTGAPVIQAVSGNSWSEATARAVTSDYLLLDGPDPGKGIPFDWFPLRANRPRLPFFLAGGIHSGNVDQALALAPFAVDVSSGVETGGEKDPVKIEQLIKKVRTYPTGVHYEKETRETQ